MSTTELYILCYGNAQRGPNLYQADKGGGIKIMFTQEESHEHHAHHKDKGADESVGHEHSEGTEPEGSHGHESHEQTHGEGVHADRDEAGGHHHEKGEHTAEHDQSEHTPA